MATIVAPRPTTPVARPHRQPFHLPPSLGASCVLALLPRQANKWVDYSGRGNHGTNYGATPTGKGRYGFAWSFDGVDDYINCGNDESLKALSRAGQNVAFEAWFKTGVGGRIIGKYFPFQFIVDNGKLAAFIYNGSVFVSGNPQYGITTVTDNEWHHAVWEIDRDGDSTFYLDGLVDGTPVDISSRTSENWYESENLHIGRKGPSFFTGLIDEVLIYNRVLTPGEIAALYEAGRP